MNYSHIVFRVFLLVSTSSVLLSGSVMGHDTDLHALMSEHAAMSSENLATFIEDIFPGSSTIHPLLTYDSKTKTPISWIKQGSVDEDYRESQAGVRHHFYVPVPRNRPTAALTDKPTHIHPFEPPINSFAWASDFYASTRPNSESWKKARDYEFDGITKASSIERSAKMGHMFKALGHVIHLNQDLSQPSHARDDNHLHIGWVYDDSSEIETYGLQNYYKEANKGIAGSEFPVSDRTWADWHGAGFTTLEAFWDRKLYNGQATALNANETSLADPSKPWTTQLTASTIGLAEYSNGNFLSDDAVYTEVGDLKPQHRFPFPSIELSTNYRQVRKNPKYGARYELFKDQISRKRTFLKKTDHGVKMEHHAALSFLDVSFGALFDATWTYKYGVSIHSDNVLEDYHSILIPKAIEYSAGILDYFFRGRIEVVDVAWDGLEYDISVRNTSGDSLNGGEFTVWKEDANGDRSRIGLPDSLTGSPLADNATFQFSVPGPEITAPTKCLVVYKGTIGAATGDDSDPVDLGLAIAAKQFTVNPQPAGPDWTQMNWTWFTPLGFGDGDASAAGDAGYFWIAAADFSDMEMAIDGYQYYTGTAATSKITINLIDSDQPADFKLKILQDGSPVLQVTLQNIGPGQNEFTFPIAAGNNSLIEVVGNVSDPIAGRARFNPPSTYGRIELSFTLSN